MSAVSLYLALISPPVVYALKCVLICIEQTVIVHAGSDANPGIAQQCTSDSFIQVL